MKRLTSKRLREAWLKFYEARGHVNIGAASLIGDGTTGVMFNVAGMQPLMPYLLGKKHPKGTRLCNVQGCVRTVDIDEVGDSRHCTFFEMMGNWSLGDYFKKEKTRWSFEFLTQEMGLDPGRIASTVFAGNEDAPRDDETAKFLEEAGVKKENIYYLGKKPNGKENNWWELDGTVGTPCGPDNEWFYIADTAPCGDGCTPECDCGHFVEVGNDVYMQYERTENGYVPLANKNIDTGFGLERILMFLQGTDDVYLTDLYQSTIRILESNTGLVYGESEDNTRAMRIIADHMRTALMLMGDKNGILPSNVGSGYILRRLLRRAIRFAMKLNLADTALVEIVSNFIDNVYAEVYPELVSKKDYILAEISKEIEKFKKTIAAGTKEFEKLVSGLERKNAFMREKDPNFIADTTISGKAAFRLFDTFGFPIEMTVEMATERGLTVDKAGFDDAFKVHQELARTTSAGSFKGGLADGGEETVKLHTACHLLLAGLRKMFGTGIEQKGSNITSERLRFDFNFDRKLTDEEVKTLEEFVNGAIAEGVPVTKLEMPLKQAHEQGAYGIHKAEEDEVVSIYKIGDIDFQICGGPHVKNTNQLGHFKIAKQEAVSSGVRRLKAILEN